ncbi:MAG: type II toxin-antitoxin system VapC family toxin [Phycisphaerales bacterium]|nr:type II toxin-antitoxin system VapC family toxin [Hyphomonadaceae bacterium]
MFILDTMVVSEDIKSQPNAKVRAWLRATPPELQYVSVLSLGELRFGIGRLASGPAKQRLEKWYAGLLPFFHGRCLHIDLAVAQRWGRLRSEVGRSLSATDSLIGATALVNDFTVVTRNERHFADFGARVINPWFA